MTKATRPVRAARSDARPRRAGRKSARGLLRNRPQLREAELPYRRIGALVRGLRQEQDMSAHALEFILLTACRLAEACDAAWCEFDLAARVWTIPAERSRGGRAHRVPLSDAAIAALEKVRGRHPTRVYPGLARRAGNHLAFRRVLERLGWPANAARDGRAAFRAWAERAGLASETVALCLGHRVILGPDAIPCPDAQRFERCRALLEEWSQWCGIVRPGSRVGARRPSPPTAT